MIKRPRYQCPHCKKYVLIRADGCLHVHNYRRRPCKGSGVPADLDRQDPSVPMMVRVPEGEPLL